MEMVGGGERKGRKSVNELWTHRWSIRDEIGNSVEFTNKKQGTCGENKLYGDWDSGKNF